MRIVVDASVLIAAISNEAEKKKLVAVTAGAELVAPSSVHWEVGNAFSALLKRKRVTLEEALHEHVLPPGLIPTAAPKWVTEALKQGARRAVFSSSTGRQTSYVWARRRVEPLHHWLQVKRKRRLSSLACPLFCRMIGA